MCLCVSVVRFDDIFARRRADFPAVVASFVKYGDVSECRHSAVVCVIVQYLMQVMEAFVVGLYRMCRFRGYLRDLAKHVHKCRLLAVDHTRLELLGLCVHGVGIGRCVYVLVRVGVYPVCDIVQELKCRVYVVGFEDSNLIS